MPFVARRRRSSGATFSAPASSPPPAMPCARSILRLLAALAALVLARGPISPLRAADGDAPPGMDTEAIFGREPRRPNPPQPLFFPPTPPPLDWPIFRTVSLAG